MTNFDGLLELREDGDYWRLLRPLTYTGAWDTWTVLGDVHRCPTCYPLRRTA